MRCIGQVVCTFLYEAPPWHLVLSLEQHFYLRNLAGMSLPCWVSPVLERPVCLSLFLTNTQKEKWINDIIQSVYWRRNCIGLSVSQHVGILEKQAASLWIRSAFFHTNHANFSAQRTSIYSLKIFWGGQHKNRNRMQKTTVALLNPESRIDFTKVAQLRVSQTPLAESDVTILHGIYRKQKYLLRVGSFWKLMLTPHSKL